LGKKKQNIKSNSDLDSEENEKNKKYYSFDPTDMQIPSYNATLIN
jgi:hypothetical protein